MNHIDVWRTCDQNIKVPGTLIEFADKEILEQWENGCVSNVDLMIHIWEQISETETK